MRFLRFENGLSQHELARLCRCTQPLISESENGLRWPGWRVLWSISELFDVSLDWLIEPTDHRSGKSFRKQNRGWWQQKTDWPA